MSLSTSKRGKGGGHNKPETYVRMYVCLREVYNIKKAGKEGKKERRRIKKITKNNIIHY